MNIRISSLRGKKVYTSVAKYLGRVNGVKFDMNHNRVASLSVKVDIRKKGLKPRVISIPYSWVTAVGDIVIINRTLSKSWRKQKESNI
ncbi:MAG: PRC-barrel domain-containing protein [Promethearchaeota archaeon]